MKKREKNTNFDIQILAKGLDSLYLYLDCAGVIQWEFIQNEVRKYACDESFKLQGLPFARG